MALESAEARAALDAGDVVALPTDTVYGLAARIDRPGATARIFELKGRPAGLALPVIVARRRQVREVAAEWPRTALVLSARFWPGPLTVVVPALPEVGRLLGGDGTTVGIRQPRHRGLQALCRDSGPLAVTSANRHGEPPCTTAQEVAGSFAGLVVVDGGRCDGIPSTVVDCTSTGPRCLRQGGIPWAWVEAALR